MGFDALRFLLELCHIVTSSRIHDVRTLIIIDISSSLWRRSIYRSRRIDLGVVTMGIVALASAMELGIVGGGGLTSTIKMAETFGCALAAVNFALPLLAWARLTAALGRKKSAFWFMIFFWYCIAMTAFCAICAYKNNGRRPLSEKLVTK